MSSYRVYINGAPGDGASVSVGGTAQNTFTCGSLEHGIDLPVVAKASDRKVGFSMHGSIYLTRSPDRATPKLRALAVKKQNLGEVHIYRSELVNESTQDIEIIKLGKCRIADMTMETLASADGMNGMPIEIIALDYESITWKWAAPHNGSPDNIVDGWNTETQSKISEIPAAATTSA